ncbi:MAG: insulinase family protein [Myxococcales bacterium]|nr:insulinase family protein [Myxococcales bacterium]
MPTRPRLRGLGLGITALALGALTLGLACHPKTTSAPPDGTKPAAGAAQAPDLAAILAASDLPPLQPEPLADDAMAVSVHRLSNGMTVYISTDRQKPSFAAWIAVRAGSRNDPADSTGLAHYLEHMLFKGSDELGTVDYAGEEPHLEKIAELYGQLRETDDPAKRQAILAEIDAETQATAKHAIPNELSRLYGAMGISGLNAFTSDDMTAYIADVPSNRLEAWAAVEGERFRDAVFRLFYPELEAVYEEKNLSLDNPWRRVAEALRAALFPGHPYGTQPTIGLVEHLKSPAYGDMVAFFERWYAPNNMAILLAGDIDAKTALPVLERTLGQLPARPLEAAPAGDLAPVKGRVLREVVADGDEGVSVAWRTVAETDADEPALVVLDWLMDNATTGLFNLHLELSQKVPDAGSSPSFLREAGYWTARATAREGQELAAVEALLMEVVGKVKRGEFKQETIDAILLHQDMSDKERLESNDGRVSKMLDAFISRREWGELLERDRRLRKVTRDDVIRVANKYLGDDRVVVYRRRGKPELPKIDKPKITPITSDTTRESPFAQKVEAMPTTPLEPEWLVEGEHYERRTLPAGPLVAVRNPRNDLFQVFLEFERGERKERLLCHAFTALDLAGYEGKPAEALREELYGLGTSVSFSCDADTTTIWISGIDRNLEASVKLLDEWIRRVELDPAELAKLAENTVSERRDRLDNSNYLGFILREHAFRGERSSFKTQPSNREIQGAKAPALQKLLRSFLDTEHQVYYFGPRSADEAAKALALGQKHRKGTPIKPTTYRKVAKPTIYFLHKDVAKTTIGLAIPQGVHPRGERAPALLLSEYLGGDMSSLIFQEIREARGLAYYANGWNTFGGRVGDEWAYVGQMGTQGDKTIEALKVYLGLLDRPIEAKRVETAKTALDQSYRATRVDPRWAPMWVRSWDKQGEKGDPRGWEWTTTAGLGSAEVEAYAARLRGKPVIISLVGDRAKVDLKALAEIGQVIEVTTDDLTSYGAFPKPKKEAAAAAAEPAKK